MAVFSRLPRLYPILDAGFLAHAGISLEEFSRELRGAGIRFLQYRDKLATDREMLDRAALLRAIFPASDSCLILNDRAGFVRAAQFDGLHVGQDDTTPASAREMLGASALIGVSTHNPTQLVSERNRCADYVATGPVYATASKLNPDPVIGLAGVREARRLTSKPLVAIGGIHRSNCLAVLDAGADSVAVISDLLPPPGESIRRRIEEFLRLTG
ncbi:MAG TPA: thiamine phosphate synthase [Acidobacteriaceae bacterium]|nr:thiamine phosphate synthase [Acidobacteriaceae bacterium]